jgi:hypothetical protein
LAALIALRAVQTTWSAAEVQACILLGSSAQQQILMAGQLSPAVRFFTEERRNAFAIKSDRDALATLTGSHIFHVMSNLNIDYQGVLRLLECQLDFVEET